MLLHPDVQSRALAEINAVCGDNVPSFEHKPLLPYIEAICREVLRWQPIVPLGRPPGSGYLIDYLRRGKGSHI
jgi:cytochrome P450